VCGGGEKAIDNFLKELNGLIRCLEDVKEVAARPGGEEEGLVADSVLASLQIQLEDCEKDVHAWIRKAADVHPDFAAGRTKSGFKKFMLAVNKNNNDEIYRQIASHRENIVMKPSVTGRYVDCLRLFVIVDSRAKVIGYRKCFGIEEFELKD
jgi:hypothetical protein